MAFINLDMEELKQIVCTHLGLDFENTNCWVNGTKLILEFDIDKLKDGMENSGTVEEEPRWTARL